MMMTCDETRMSLGVYALGALDPEERVLVEAHLAECAGCRAELEELSGVTAFLGRVSEDDVAQAVSPPAAVLDRLLLDARTRRRRVTRLMLSLAASVALLGLGGGVVWTVVRSDQGSLSTAASPAMDGGGQEGNSALSTEAAPSPPSPLAPSAGARAGKEAGEDPQLMLDAPPVYKGSDGTGRVRATVTAFPGQGATTVKVVLSGVAKGTRCRLVVVGTDGSRETAGNWTVDRAAYDASGAFTGTTTIPPDGIASFEITTAGGRVLLTVPVR
ncbi:hypothetical protein FHS43_000480 [Streptosporangium becharense]|uniref:Putative zinc-finger domain-containing protein n=1 Tax=Streptosporangium becharense TaxID=1816182 RepID=A0A7W9MG57_9ACTN|nr:zf-HC2 domain-containing protein [Streptosporangium becharense]MBB2909234.1 hypothetical protein [Streptosporangium becharense]MBB5819747.1 hypothetical protein [Streptosporangium becharense]